MMADILNDIAMTRVDPLEGVALRLGQEQADEVLISAVLEGVAEQTGAGWVNLLVAGSESDELQVRSVHDVTGELTPAEFAGRDSAIIRQALTSGQVCLEPLEADSPAIVAVPLSYAGRSLGVICAGQLPAEITESDLATIQALANQAAMLLERERLVLALRAQEKAQREFVSLTTHQLRVPLTSISGFTDLMLSGIVGPLTERQERFMQTIRRNVDRMGTLIADLSDLNRLQDGRMPLQSSQIDLKTMIEMAIQGQADAITGRLHEIQRHWPTGLPLAAGDGPAIRRVLEKLLANAILYTPEGGVLTVGAVQQDGLLQVTVADSGVGISAEDQAQLFTPFFRSESEFVREKLGWGLSLALAKALVEAQGGTMWCESESGQGSAFHFTLPVAKVEGQ